MRTVKVKCWNCKKIYAYTLTGVVIAVRTLGEVRIGHKVETKTIADRSLSKSKTIVVNCNNCTKENEVRV